MEKRCRRCKVFKEKTEFWVDNSRPDKLFKFCKPCATNWYREKRKRNPKSYAAKARRYYDNHKKELKKKRAKRYLQERDKNLARSKTKNALYKGVILRKNCETCGNKQSVAHHSDYTKPLEVTWLCNSCHGIWHRDNGEGKRAG